MTRPLHTWLGASFDVVALHTCAARPYPRRCGQRAHRNRRPSAGRHPAVETTSRRRRSAPRVRDPGAGSALRRQRGQVPVITAPEAARLVLAGMRAILWEKRLPSSVRLWPRPNRGRGLARRTAGRVTMRSRIGGLAVSWTRSPVNSCRGSAERLGRLVEIDDDRQVGAHAHVDFRSSCRRRP